MRDRIETERLILRQTEIRDAVALSKFGSDFDIARMTGSFPYPFPLLSAEFKIMTFHAAKRRGLAHPYAITLKDQDEMIGVADLSTDCRQLWNSQICEYRQIGVFRTSMLLRQCWRVLSLV